MGEFSLKYSERNLNPIADMGAREKVYAATPEESGRKKIRLSFDAASLEALALKSTVPLTLELFVGGVESDTQRFRMLHANAPKFPGRLNIINGELVFDEQHEKSAVASSGERVIMLVPHEDEASHRRLKPLEVLKSRSAVHSGLFIGDPLIEGVQLDSPSQLTGLAERLAKATPQIEWKAVSTPGPFRYRPLLQMLAGLDALDAANAGAKLPQLAVINLGSGDVARQTPLHTFERALDTLIARLAAGGVERIIIVGVIPEPWREKQCEPYQERVNSVVRQHHVSGVDLFHMWSREPNWEKRFAIDASDKDEISSPVPNAATLDEIVQDILSRM
jgi:lysophospholipase L1-like esterase